jgi:hypothetical protein
LILPIKTVEFLIIMVPILFLLMSDEVVEETKDISKTDIAATQDIRLSSSLNAMGNTFKVLLSCFSYLC